MRTYNIPEIPDVTETLKMISNVDTWSARLKEMQALQEELKADLVNRKKYDDLDAALSQVRAKQAEADGIRQQAEQYAAEVKANADKELAATKEICARLRDELAAEKKAADEFDNKLMGVAMQQNDEARRLGDLERTLETELAKAREQQADAERLRRQLEAKLGQLNAIAAA